MILSSRRGGRQDPQIGAFYLKNKTGGTNLPLRMGGDPTGKCATYLLPRVRIDRVIVLSCAPARG